MNKNIINILEKKLIAFNEKKVYVIQDGFLQSKYWIPKFKYFFEYEVLNITYEEGNYLKINTNQIYKIEFNLNELIFYLDNDTIICFSIDKN